MNDQVPISPGASVKKDILLHVSGSDSQVFTSSLPETLMFLLFSVC